MIENVCASAQRAGEKGKEGERERQRQRERMNIFQFTSYNRKAGSIRKITSRRPDPNSNEKLYLDNRSLVG